MIQLLITDPDFSKQELTVFINNKGRVFIEISDGDINSMQSGYITLDKEDVNSLITELQKLEKLMDN